MKRPAGQRRRGSLRQVEQWDIFEIVLSGPQEREGGGNPFVDVELWGRFTHAEKEVLVEGFYDGQGVYRIRLMPERVGRWRFQTLSNVPELSGIRGEFECVPASRGRHGPVRVSRRFHFAYADGRVYRPIGTTCYAWVHQPESLQRQTLRQLKRSPFNKLRMCIFPKHYVFNRNEPEIFPFERAGDGFDFSRFNPTFWKRLEERIGQLRELGIEADLILFHPYDRWGFAHMGRANNERYLRYAVARLAAYSNVWWSLANEYDLMRGWSMEDWDRAFQVIQRHDPAGHLRSIHNCGAFYDHGRPWVTHCSIQWQHAGLDQVVQWREQYGKPVVVDECGYEGNIDRDWGNLPGQELVHRFWTGMSLGGYVGHGETFLDPQEILWWSKGGRLRGKSPARLAFLRGIFQEVPEEADLFVDERTGRRYFGVPGEYYLIYLGIHQPRHWVLGGRPGRYRVRLIDTWGMQVRALARAAEAGATVELPGRAYLALEMRRVS